MLSRKETACQISKHVFTCENAPMIIRGLLCSAFTIGLNIATPYVFAQTVKSFDSDGISPLAMAGAYGAVFTLAGVISHFRTLVFAPLGHQVTKKLVNSHVNNVMEQSLDYHNKTKKGTQDGYLIKYYVNTRIITNEIFTQIFPTTIEMVIATTLLSQRYDIQIGLGLLGTALAYTGYNILTNKKVVSARDLSIIKGMETYYHIGEMLARYKEIHISNNLKYSKKQLDEIMNQQVDTAIAADVMISKVGIGQELISGAGFTGLCLLAVNSILLGRYSPSDFIVISAYLAQFSRPLGNLGMSISQGSSALTELAVALTEAQKPSSIIDYHPEVKFNVDYNNAGIKFDNVSFKYDIGDDNKVLDGISFEVKPGQKVAVVGDSGGGKSTLLKLLYRFCDPTGGSITINGQDTRDVGLYSLRSAMGVVLQESLLFNKTIYENIEFGGLSLPGGVTNEEVMAAAEAVCLSDMDLNRSAGENGDELSGGQKQRVAIARALLKKPRVVLLDEVTSNLDVKVEREVQQNMDKLFKEITTFVITHRLVNAINADNIIVLSKGKIVQQGKHQELMKDEEGLYFKLWKKEHENIKKSLEAKEDVDEKSVDTSSAIGMEEKKSARAAVSLFRPNSKGDEQKSRDHNQAAQQVDAQDDEKRCGCSIM